MTQANPFAASEPQQQAAPAANPFGPGVAQQQAAPAYAEPTPQYAPHPAAPQAYAPPAQQQYAPAPQQAVQQQYAPPAAPAAQAGPPPAIGTVGSVGAPPPVGDGNGAKLADMYGRLVLVFPHDVTTRPRNPQYITAEQRAQGRLTEELVTATVVVLDMGPGSDPRNGFIEFGGAPHELPPRPHTERAPLPYVRKAMWITQSRLVAQLKPFIPAPGAVANPCAGRVTKAGPERNSPWYLSEASQQDIELCNAYMRLVAGGQYPHPLA